MLRIILLAFLAGSLLACSSGNQDPQIFLPTVYSPGGTDLDSLRKAACDPAAVDLTNAVLTQQNFTAIFHCANYDGSLAPLSNLITSPDFPDFLTSVNAVMQSKSTESLHDLLQSWFVEGSDGTSKLDRLLPVLSSVIKNPSFQDGLPVFSNILGAGQTVWPTLLPGLGDVVYQDRFPDNLDDVFVLFDSFSTPTKAGGPTPDHATDIKSWATFLKSTVDGETAAMGALELLNSIGTVQLPGTSLYEYFDRMNDSGTWSTYFLDSGAARGEVLNSELNSEADNPTEAPLSPAQRQDLALRNLFIRPTDGSGTDAPLVQLVGLVEEFQKPHPDFMPAFARWFGANGPKVINGLTEYVVRSLVFTDMSDLKVDTFINTYALANGLTATSPMTNTTFAALLTKGFTSPDFTTWLTTAVVPVDTEIFGPDNAVLLKNSNIVSQLASLYAAPEIAAYGGALITAGSSVPLSTALRRFANKHRGDDLKVTFGGKTEGMDLQLEDLWWAAAQTTLGESVVFNYVVKIGQTLLNQIASDFSKNGQTYSQWFFNSPYDDPATLESISAYAVRDLGLMDKYTANKTYLETTFPGQVFTNDEDKAAFKLLVDQVPNLWLYIKSGTLRSGADLTRSLAANPEGAYLSNNLVTALISAQDSGLIRKGVRLIEAYQAMNPGLPAAAQEWDPNDFDHVRQISEGVDALKRMMRSLFEPATGDDYTTTTMAHFVVPVQAILADGPRTQTETLVLTSCDQILGLTNVQINNFIADLDRERVPGSLDDRRATFQSISNMLKDGNFPAVITHLNAFFQENAVKPALDFLAAKIDDGTLPKVLLMIRRLLGFGG